MDNFEECLREIIREVIENTSIDHIVTQANADALIDELATKISERLRP